MLHMWAIHKLYISHVQPTVQASGGPYQISRKWRRRWWKTAATLIFFIFTMVHLWPVLQAVHDCTWLMYSLPLYDLHMAHIPFRSAIRSARRTEYQGTFTKESNLTADNDCTFQVPCRHQWDEWKNGPNPMIQRAEQKRIKRLALIGCTSQWTQQIEPHGPISKPFDIMFADRQNLCPSL